METVRFASLRTVSQLLPELFFHRAVSDAGANSRSHGVLQNAMRIHVHADLELLIREDQAR